MVLALQRDLEGVEVIDARQLRDQPAFGRQVTGDRRAPQRF
jgi:hypothetical protein